MSLRSAAWNWASVPYTISPSGLGMGSGAPGSGEYAITMNHARTSSTSSRSRVGSKPWSDWAMASAIGRKSDIVTGSRLRPIASSAGTFRGSSSRPSARIAKRRIVGSPPLACGQNASAPSHAFSALSTTSGSPNARTCSDTLPIAGRGPACCITRSNAATRAAVFMSPARRRTGRQHVDRSDDVARLDLVHAAHVFRQHARKDGVLPVQTRVVDEVHEDLRVAGVAAARGQSHRATDVRRPDLVAHEPWTKLAGV